MTTPAVELDQLTKDYPLQLGRSRLRAVDGLSLAIGGGQVYGLLGPNGSGKSTTLKMILGLVRPTRGACRVWGEPAGSPAARAAIGFLPEGPYFHRFLTGRELVRFHALLAGLPRPGREDRVAAVLEQTGLRAAADRRVGTYSKGMLQRLGVAQAIVHDPPLVVLDEPTAGLDPLGVAEMGELIRRLRRAGKTVLLCSHLLAQVEELCDRVAILHHGRLLVEGAVDDLTSRADVLAVVVELGAEPECAALQEWLAARAGRIVERERPRASLERVFVERIAGAGNGGRP